SIGPLGIRIEPWGKTGVDEAQAYFREQAEALVSGGVDLFILETFRDLNEIGSAIAAVRSVSDAPIVAQMTTEEGGNTLDGTPPERFVPELERRGATMIGVNCSVGPASMLDTIERMASVTRLRLAAQPNAGKPRDVEGRNIYLCSPEYMASYARRFIRHNVRIVGVELLPPRGYDCSIVLDRARALKSRGIDVVSIPDGFRAGAHISALSLAVLIEQQAGIETVLHYSCRDRNLLGIQSDLLGAH